MKQHRRFVEAAREAGCGDDDDAFEKALRKVASAPPPKHPAKKPKAKKPAK